jgi:hypothetical protein
MILLLNINLLATGLVTMFVCAPIEGLWDASVEAQCSDPGKLSLVAATGLGKVLSPNSAIAIAVSCRSGYLQY